MKGCFALTPISLYELSVRIRCVRAASWFREVSSCWRWGYDYGVGPPLDLVCCNMFSLSGFNLILSEGDADCKWVRIVALCLTFPNVPVRLVFLIFLKPSQVPTAFLNAAMITGLTRWRWCGSVGDQLRTERRTNDLIDSRSERVPPVRKNLTHSFGLQIHSD